MPPGRSEQLAVTDLAESKSKERDPEDRKTALTEGLLNIWRKGSVLIGK